MAGLNILQIVQDVFAAFQEVKGKGTGKPPTSPGAEQLAETLRPPPGQAKPGGIADAVFIAWGAGAIKSLEAITPAEQNQLIFAGQAAKEPGVIVKNKKDRPLEGVLIRFAVSGGGGTITPLSGAGTVSQNEVPTNADGEAKSGKWTLGDKGDNTLTVTAGNKSIVFTVRTVTKLEPTTPVDQTANVKAAVPQPPKVKLTDSVGRPVQGEKVRFQASEDSKVVESSVDTDEDGLASCDGWTLGQKPIDYKVTATAGPPSAGFNVEFRAKATTTP